MPTGWQSRTLPGPSNGMDTPNRLWFWNNAWQPADTMPGGLGPTNQTTFSFRGSAEKDYSRMTGPELRKNLRSEYLSRYDTGHEFQTQKAFSDPPSLGRCECTFTKFGVTDRAVYVGPFFPDISTVGDPTNAGQSLGQMNAWGRAAIARTIPTAPEAGIAAALIELREGLPKLVGAALHKNGLKAKGLPKAVGDEFLNVEFGWKPLVGDIVKTANAVVDFQKNLEKLQRGSSQITRRRAQLASESRSTVTPLTGFSFPRVYLPRMLATDLTFNIMAFSGNAELCQTVTTDVWFAGAYTYYLHQGDSFGEKMKGYAEKAHALLGATLDAETIWQVTPWSWLLDWFADTNVFMTNITNLNADSTVLRYGYIMSTTTVRNQYIVTGIRPQAGASCPSVAMSTRSNVVKQRVRATPYGFGVDLGSMSNRRWSILSALGMTKSDRALKP